MSSTASTPRASRSPTPRRPPDPSPTCGGPASSRPHWSTRRTGASSTSSSWAPVSRAPRGGDARRGGVQRQGLLLPGQPATCALDRGTGGHQRRQELQGGRRLGVPPLLRHREGRRLPRAESNVYRLAEVSANIIDQCVAQGVPFAREYGASSTTVRSVVCRCRAPSTPRPDRAAAAHRRVPGAGAAGRRGHRPAVQPSRDARAHRRRRRAREHHRPRPRHRRDRDHIADVVVLASGGYGNVFYLSTNAMGSNVTATWRAHRKGAYMANLLHRSTRPASPCPASTRAS